MVNLFNIFGSRSTPPTSSSQKAASNVSGLFGRPYKKRISGSIIKGMVSKMASYKGGRKLYFSELDEILKKNPKLTSDSHNYQIVKYIRDSMRGGGPKDPSIETWRVKKFIKDFGQSLKDAAGKETGITITRYGRKVLQGPETTFYRDVIGEQIKKEAPTGPSKEEIIRQKKQAEARARLNIRKMVMDREKEEGPALEISPEEGKTKTEEETKSPATSPLQPGTGGSPRPTPKTLDTGSSFVGTGPVTEDQSRLDSPPPKGFSGEDTGEIKVAQDKGSASSRDELPKEPPGDLEID